MVVKKQWIINLVGGLFRLCRSLTERKTGSFGKLTNILTPRPWNERWLNKLPAKGRNIVETTIILYP